MPLADYSDIRIGRVYSGKGKNHRYIEAFERHGKDVAYPYSAFIIYRQRLPSGRMGSTRRCWCETFRQWANGEVEPDE